MINNIVMVEFLNLFLWCLIKFLSVIFDWDVLKLYVFWNYSILRLL